MTDFDNLLRCDGCGVEITWAPVVRQSPTNPAHLLYYCCQDCLEGRGCDCAARMEIEEERARNQTLVSYSGPG